MACTTLSHLSLNQQMDFSTPFPGTISLPLAVDQLRTPSGPVINWLKISKRCLCSICCENYEFSLFKIVCLKALIKLTWAVEWREWRFGAESCQEWKPEAAEEGAGDQAMDWARWPGWRVMVEVGGQCVGFYIWFEGRDRTSWWIGVR